MTFKDALQYLKNITPLRITLSGDIGAGKSTFAKRLSEELDIPRVYIGQLMREEAKRRNLTVQELHTLLEQDPELDKQMDAIQTQKGREIERGVFEGRTAWHFIENPDVNVYFSVDPHIAVDRVFKDTENKLRDSFATKEALLKADQERAASNQQRFKEFYAIDIRDLNNFHIVHDTSAESVDEVYRQTVIQIAQFLQQR